MAAHRRANVQVLRRLAQKHGVARVADDANRDKVKKMAKAVLEAVEHLCVMPDEWESLGQSMGGGIDFSPMFSHRDRFPDGLNI